MNRIILIPGIVPAIIALLLIGILPVVISYGRKRRQKLEAWAGNKGLSYESALPANKEINKNFISDFIYQSVLAELKNTSVINVIHGVVNAHEWMIFDLEGWREHRYQESDALQWTVVSLRKRLHCPDLLIEPAVPFFSRFHPHRLSSVKTGYSKFDKCFFVFGDTPAAKEFLNSDILSYLLETIRIKRRWYRHLYLNKNGIALCQPSFASPTHIEDMMEIAADLYRHINFSPH